LAIADLRSYFLRIDRENQNLRSKISENGESALAITLGITTFQPYLSSAEEKSLPSVVRKINDRLVCRLYGSLSNIPKVGVAADFGIKSNRDYFDAHHLRTGDSYSLPIA